MMIKIVVMSLVSQWAATERCTSLASTKLQLITADGFSLFSISLKIKQNTDEGKNRE